LSTPALDAQEIKRLLAADQANEQGITALMVACQDGHLDCVRTLLEAGAPVAQADEQGFTGLMLACGKGHVECVRTLLEAGAPVEQAVQDVGTALMLAC
jgi:ankyrin repeat protein